MGACNKNHSMQSGILTSPLYPKPYPNDITCFHNIKVTRGKYVELTILRLDIHCKNSTLDDYIEMRDGDNQSAPLIMKFCYNSSHFPMTLSTSQNSLRLRYDYLIKQTFVQNQFHTVP